MSQNRSLGLMRGTSVDITSDKAVIIHNWRKGVNIDIRLEPQDVVKLRRWLNENIAPTPTETKEGTP